MEPEGGCSHAGDWHFAEIASLAEGLRSHALSSAELVRAALERIRDCDPWLNAFVHVNAAQALKQAELLDRETRAGRHRSVLHGIPFAVKDIFLTRDMPTTACSRVLKDGIASGRDAAVVMLLRKLGAIPIGKTTTYEFATGGPSFDLPYPPARNPWDLERTTAGSSSGSAVAVAASMVPFSLGTDTGGSVRTPAAYCGVASFRPTFGSLSTDGILPLAPSFDTVGIMARRVRECALIAGTMGGPARSAGTEARHGDALRNATVGIPDDLGPDAGVSTAMSAAIDRARSALQRAGARVRTVAFPPVWDFTVVFRTLMLAEAYAIHGGMLTRNPGQYGRALRYRLAPGRLLTGADIVSAHAMLRRLRGKLTEVFGYVDLVLLPATRSHAPLLSAMKLSDNFAVPQLTAAFTVGGNPVATLPAGLSPAGLPLGIQLAAAPHKDEFLLAAASRLEQELESEIDTPAPPQHGRRISRAGRQPGPSTVSGREEQIEEADTRFNDLRARLPSATVWESAIDGRGADFALLSEGRQTTA